MTKLKLQQNPNMNCRNQIFLFCVVLVLTLNFKLNFFNSTSFFDHFQYDGESLVVGRLVLSERDGIFSHAGFLGRALPSSETVNPYWYQYEAYQNAHNFKDYEAYYTQSAFHAFVYGLFCLVTGLSGDVALDYFKWWVSFFTAAIFTLFLAWVQRRFGWAAALFTLVTICFSQWVTAFGRNLFWVLGAFYVPFVAALWHLEKYDARVKRPLRVTFWLMFSAMLLKCLLNGFEFITTTLVMAVTPWVFYAVAERWSWRKFVQRAAVASAGALTATIAALALLAVQLSAVMGSLGAGFQYILFSFGKRAHGSSENFDPIFQQSLDSSLWDVLSTYWNSYAFYIAHWFDSPLWQMMTRFSFGFFVIVFAVVSYVVFSSKRIRQFPAFRRQQVALTVMLWVSLLAPLSWFVIFKGHSYLHAHMNPIVWHMPFMLLGAALAVRKESNGLK